MSSKLQRVKDTYIPEKRQNRLIGICRVQTFRGRCGNNPCYRKWQDTCRDNNIQAWLGV